MNVGSLEYEAEQLGDEANTGELRDTYNILAGNLKGRDHLEDPDIDVITN